MIVISNKNHFTINNLMKFINENAHNLQNNQNRNMNKCFTVYNL